MGKRALFLVMLAILLFTGVSQANAAMDGSLHIIVNTDFLVSDVQPIIKNGRTLAPVRALAGALDFNVSWVAASKTVIITKGEETIKLTINKKKAFVNSDYLTLDVPPQIVSGRALVPLRFVSEALGLNAKYDKWGETPLVWITEFHLLKAADVKTDENYTRLENDGLPPFYKLKQNGETARHIRLGATISMVKDAYGVPFKQDLDAANSGTISYTTKFLPRTDSGIRMIFEFENAILKAVTISF